MTFALYPDDGKTPPRIWRRHEAGLADPFAVSALEPGTNILHINAPLFDKLHHVDQHRVLRTHETILRVSDPAAPMPDVMWPRTPSLTAANKTLRGNKLETFYAV